MGRGTRGGLQEGGGWSLPSGFSMEIMYDPPQGTGSSLLVPSNGYKGCFRGHGWLWHRPWHPSWGGDTGGDCAPHSLPLQRLRRRGLKFLQANARG